MKESHKPLAGSFSAFFKIQYFKWMETLIRVAIGKRVTEAKSCVIDTGKSVLERKKWKNRKREREDVMRKLQMEERG
jgi:uncharacterized metal-binding protein